MLLLALFSVAAAATLGDIARRDTGDVFTLVGNECGPTQCAEHGAGASAHAASCACACPQRAPLFREDRELCVDDLPECSLATFGSGIGLQRIPFVYLPLKGQIIHPSREITFQNVKTPICAVSGAQFLTRKGFLDLRNTLDADVPFSLFRDEGRTFLQWSGEDEVRARMSGRVMVVRLLCRDVAATPTSPLDLRGVFTPCVAFRVQGTPPRHITNVTEVQFSPNAQTSDTSTASGLTITEYIAIGISSLLLGLIYVASVFLFLHIRKRRKAASDEATLRRLKGLKNKDGSVITERDIIRINNERVPSLPSVLGQDDGVVKKNPLLTVGRQFHENKANFTSDSGSNISDSEDFPDSSALSEENHFNSQTTSAVIHQRSELRHQTDGLELTHRDESGIERLPDEHVSIVETIDDREITRPVGTTRRKLYFNPAYFEPHLMADPPAAALEFLIKIREVISIAKHKMTTKRFQPVLNQIPEEETYPSNGNSMDFYLGLGSLRSGSAISLKRENSRKRSINCVGCPGCKTDNGNEVQNQIKFNVTACSNCINNKGDKQNSIRKWLENIPSGKLQFYNDFIPNGNQMNLANSLMSLPSAENRNHIRKHSSFSGANSMLLTENFSSSKRTSSRSVRSEPPTRTYNVGIPLPEFENIAPQDSSSLDYCQTVSRANNISPIGFNPHRSNSFRSHSEMNRSMKLFNNNNSLPDMVNEAIAIDQFSKSSKLHGSDDERFSNKFDNHREPHSDFVRNNSDSPLGNEYETDSLERASNKKSVSTLTEYPEVPSSQASPSLSNALPLEEELTMRNAVYKHNSSNSNTPSPPRDIRVDQNHYETIEIKKNKTKESVITQNNDFSLVSEVYVNNNFGSTPTSPSGSECSMGSRKLNSTKKELEEKPGCLTIEVKDPPENYIKIHESDDFEPDTLDRKHPKHQQIMKNIQLNRYDFLKLNDCNNKISHRIQLRSSGTFMKTNGKIEYTSKFNSVRNEQQNQQCRPKLTTNVFNGSQKVVDTSAITVEEEAMWSTEEGRILTLELRHSKRQRQCTPPTIKQLKNLARPDILPPLPPTEEYPIYEKPTIPPRRVESSRLEMETYSKPVKDRSLSPKAFMMNPITETDTSPSDSVYGPSCSPLRVSAQSQNSEYDDLRNHQDKSANSSEQSRIPMRKFGIDSNTFIKGQNTIEGQVKMRSKRKKGSVIEDSGYLSSDSTSSRQFQRKLVIAKINSSESDDTENEARSESGAESIETHSVYFGSFRKVPTKDNYSVRNSKGARSSCSSKKSKKSNNSVN